MKCYKNEIEENGWVGIDNILDLLDDNIIKMSAMTDVMPNDMRKYIDAQLDTIINKAWEIKMRRANVSM